MEAIITVNYSQVYNKLVIVFMSAIWLVVIFYHASKYAKEYQSEDKERFLQGLQSGVIHGPAYWRLKLLKAYIICIVKTFAVAILYLVLTVFPIYIFKFTVENIIVAFISFFITALVGVIHGRFEEY